MLTIFDIGMYDGADTAYYLELGFRVVAVEANPGLVQRAMTRFATEVKTGRLECVQGAIANSEETVELAISGEDLGLSSTVRDLLANRLGTIRVPGITMDRLFGDHGVPHLLKVDIEGADGLCVRALSRERRPQYLSFEVGDDPTELIEHARSIGYDRFKVVNQVSFLELANQRSIRVRLVRRAIRLMGYENPRRVRRGGRFFISGHSSGPVPWLSDGRWRSADETLRAWNRARGAGELTDWYDIHATVGAHTSG